MLYATVRQRKIYVKKPTTVIQNGVGVDELTLDMDAEWGSMDSIICVFTLKYTESTSTTETDSDGNTTTKITTETKEITKQMLHTYGTTLLVPWECLVKTGLLSVSCTGYVGSTKIMTTMLPDSFWNVVQNGAITGDETIDPTPTLYQQIVAAAGSATTAAAAANDAASEIKAAAAAGEYDGKTPTVRIGSTTTGATGSEAQVTNSGTSTDLVLNFTIPRGTQGTQGAPGVTPAISIGKVETLETGAAATATMTGTAKNPVLNLGIPKGDAGAPGTAPTITATKSGKSTTLYADGKQIAEVKDGEDGTPGTNGTSVSISKISESTADGGENVVTFNDGKTLTVKNGGKGSDGYSPSVTVSKSGTETTVTATDKSGTTSAVVKDGEDGYSPSAKVTKTDTGVKISITDKDGTTEQEVENGTCPEVGDDYELIETITLTEDVASVSRSVETDGTAYDFDGMKVCFKVPATSTANSGYVMVGFCGAYSGVKPSAYVRLRESTTGRISYASVEMRKKDGYWRAQIEEYFTGYSAPNISDRVNVQDHGKSYMHSWPVSDNPKLTELNIAGNSSWVIPSGTTIYVYAIRHDGAAGSGDMLTSDYDADGAVKSAGGIAKYVAENAGSGISVSGATVGQTVKISAVDDSGVPTAWEAVDRTWTEYATYNVKDLTFPAVMSIPQGKDVFFVLNTVDITADSSTKVKFSVTTVQNETGYAARFGVSETMYAHAWSCYIRMLLLWQEGTQSFWPIAQIAAAATVYPDQTLIGMPIGGDTKRNYFYVTVDDASKINTETTAAIKIYVRDCL